MQNRRRGPDFVALLACLMAVGGAFGPSVAAHEVRPLREAEAKEYGLDASFYKKCTSVQGILIATSERVSDYAHLEAAYQFDMIMKSIDPEVAERIRDRKVLCILIGHAELTSDLPQYKSDKTGEELDFYNWRQRGFLSWPNGRPTVVFAEEDVLEYEGGMQLESILIHEFGHVIHGAGFDEKLQNRLTDAYQHAKEAKLWNDGRAAQRFRRVKSETPVRLLDALIASFPDESPELLEACLDGGDILVNGKPTDSDVKVTKDDKVLIVFGGPKDCYAGKNRSEYWAEGVQDWYDTNRTMDHDHNHIHTREQLKRYDPVLARLCEDVLGNSPWRFTSPRDRAGQGHLKGYDPATAPTAEDPEHIKEAANDYYDEYWKDYWQRLRDKHATAPKENEEGFEPLFNGKDLNGWAKEGKAGFQAKDGMLVCNGSGNWPTWLRTEEVFENFVLRLEYKTLYGAESGVFFHAPLHGRTSHVGFEVQIGGPGGLKRHSTGAIFDAVAPLTSAARHYRDEEFDQLEIIMDWPTLKVRLNGQVVQNLNVEEHESLRYRPRMGYIGLQDRGKPVLFRNIRVKRLPDRVRNQWQPLLNGKDLQGWTVSEKCTAKWSVDNGELLGEEGHGYLISDAEFRNCEFQTYVKSSPLANGGIFFRWKTGAGRGFEIQIEDIPDSNDPTGSIYGRVRAERMPFQPGEWVLMQVVVNEDFCVVRVNGETVAESHEMGRARSGNIALQMHTGNGWIRWKDMRVRPLDTPIESRKPAPQSEPK